MKRHLLILYLLLIIGCLKMQAQDTLELSSAIMIGMENNFNIKISEGQKEIAATNNTVGNAGFLTILDATAAQRYTVENTSQTFISGD